MESLNGKVESNADILPRETRIRQRAYELYLSRGNQDGFELDDWLQAEGETLPVEDRPQEPQPASGLRHATKATHS